MSIKFEGAEKDINEFAQKAQNPNSGIAYDLFVKADALRLNKYYKESIIHYLNSILVKRHNPEAYYGLGIAYKHLKDYDRAIEAFEKAKDASQFDSKIHYELGICYLINGIFCKAIKSLITCIRLNPKKLETQIQLGIAHEMVEEDELALMIYQKIIETNPSYIKAYTQKATLHMNLEEYQEAATVFNQILKINPDYYRAYLGIGICFDKLNKTIDAVRFYKKFLSLKPYAKNAKDVKSRIKIIQKESTKKENFLKLVSK